MVNEGVVGQYTKDFAGTLHEDIEVMWTGVHVVPANGVSYEHASEISDIYGKKIKVMAKFIASTFRFCIKLTK